MKPNNPCLLAVMLVLVGLVVESCYKETGMMIDPERIRGAWFSEAKPPEAPSACVSYEYSVAYRSYLFFDSGYTFTQSSNTRSTGRSLVDTPDGKKCRESRSPIAVKVVAKDSGQWRLEGQTLHLTGRNGESRKILVEMERNTGDSVLYLDKAAYLREKTSPRSP